MRDRSKLKFNSASLRSAIQIMEEIASRPCCQPFLVDPSTYDPKYSHKIKNPMFINIIINKILDNAVEYKSVEDWYLDFLLLRKNTYAYFGENDLERPLVDALITVFEKKYEQFLYSNYQIFWEKRCTNLAEKINQTTKKMVTQLPIELASALSVARENEQLEQPNPRTNRRGRPRKNPVEQPAAVHAEVANQPTETREPETNDQPQSESSVAHQTPPASSIDNQNPSTCTSSNTGFRIESQTSNSNLANLPPQLEEKIDDVAFDVLYEVNCLCD